MPDNAYPAQPRSKLPQAALHRDGPVLALLRRAASDTNVAPSFKLPRRFTAFSNFLSLEYLETLTHFALARETRFARSGLLSEGHERPIVLDTYRRSRVLYDLEGLRPVLIDTLLTALPAVLRDLEIDPFPVAAIDAQLTATNDKEFFRLHTDNGHALSGRQISFTCFIHREPMAFFGGDLCLYESQLSAKDPQCEGRGATRIAPTRNTVIFFPSGILHEILPVTCPSRRFRDSRFTWNGWIYRR